MTQEQINTLKNEIVSLNKQVDILNSEDFADTVPEIETAKTAIKNYITKAQAEIDKFEAEHAPKTVKIEGIEGLEELLKNPIVKQILELFLNGLKNLSKQCLLQKIQKSRVYTTLDFFYIIHINNVVDTIGD